MNERLKALRNALGLSQQAFADKLRIGRGTVANYEVGRNEPIDAIINLICQEFNVNETWLRTGEGEMFNPASADGVQALIDKYGVSRRVAVAIERFARLDDRVQEALLAYFTEVADALREEEATAEREIESRVAAYREQLYAEARSGRTRDRPTRDELLHAELQRQLDAEKEAPDETGAFWLGESSTA